MESQGEILRLKQFLLGSLEQADADEIGVQIIANRKLDEKVSFAEEELIEDFLDGALTEEENDLFYLNFLTTPERIELLEETAALKDHAKNYFKKEAVIDTEEKKSVSFLDGLKGFLTLNLRPLAAVLIILVLGGIAWRVFLYDPDGFSQIERDYAALNSKDLGNAPETANFSNKSLTPGTFRDSALTAKLNAAALTDNVLFRLALPPATPKETLFSLELLRDSQIVFKQKDLKTYQNQSGQEVKVILPKSVLTKGIYQFKLNNGISYSLAVE
jgi:hypothetical protein